MADQMQHQDAMTGEAAAVQEAAPNGPEAAQAASDASTAAATPKRVRRGRKRLRFTKLPKPAYPVRALWEAASEEEKKASHRLCVGILEWWLGKSTRLEISQRLGLPPIRLWQMSQQALAGMLAGLLRQPRLRGKVVIETGDPPVDVHALKREADALKKRLKEAQDVAFVLGELRDAASPRARPAPPRKACPPAAPKSVPEKKAAPKKRKEPDTGTP